MLRNHSGTCTSLRLVVQVNLEYQIHLTRVKYNFLGWNIYQRGEPIPIQPISQAIVHPWKKKTKHFIRRLRATEDCKEPSLAIEEGGRDHNRRHNHNAPRRSRTPIHYRITSFSCLRYANQTISMESGESAALFHDNNFSNKNVFFLIPCTSPVL